MKIKKTNCGKKFDYEKCDYICSNKCNNDSRRRELLRTASGVYLLARITCRQGEFDTYEIIGENEAMDFACTKIKAEDFKEEFGKYPEEDI